MDKNIFFDLFNIDKNEFITLMTGTVSIVYVYMICLLMAGVIESANDIDQYRFHCAYDIGMGVPRNWNIPNWNSILNCATLWVLNVIYSRQQNGIVAWFKNYGSPHCFFSAKCSSFQFLSNMFSTWITILNLICLLYVIQV